jgi:Domain of unknown function (DUF1992)
MADRYESYLDRQIREAAERGEFDNLPGTGKPLPNRGELHDEEWWLKALIAREGISSVLPTTLALRREREDLPATLAQARTAERVRELVTDFNRRVLQALRGPVDGPAVVLRTVNVDEAVAQWRAARP